FNLPRLAACVGARLAASGCDRRDLFYGELAARRAEGGVQLNAALDHAPESDRGGWLLALYAALVIAFLILPILVIVPLSASSDAYLRFPPGGWGLRWYYAAFNEARWWRATWNSLVVG